MKRSGQISIAAVIALLLFSSVLYGDTWTANRRLTTNSGVSTYPAIAVDGENIYVVWTDDTPGNEEIYFKRSLDGGANWIANRNLSRTAVDSANPAIAVDGENIYVVWTEWRERGAKVYFKRSIDGGANWEANRRLSDTGADDSFNPVIAVNGFSIYVAWLDLDYPSAEDHISFRRSTDGGVTWGNGEQLTIIGDYFFFNAIAAAGSNVYLVWQYWPEEGNHEIYFKRSMNEGVAWGENMRITNTADFSTSPAIVAKDSKIYVVWQDYTPGNNEIYFKRSDDEGDTWEGNRRLTYNAGNSRYPALAADGSNVYVVWEDSKPGNSEIYFKKCVLD